MRGGERRPYLLLLLVRVGAAEGGRTGGGSGGGRAGFVLLEPGYERLVLLVVVVPVALLLLLLLLGALLRCRAGPAHPPRVVLGLAAPLGGRRQVRVRLLPLVALALPGPGIMGLVGVGFGGCGYLDWRLGIGGGGEVVGVVEMVVIAHVRTRRARAGSRGARPRWRGSPTAGPARTAPPRASATGALCGACWDGWDGSGRMGWVGLGWVGVDCIDK